jgi:hypothetical protein
MVEHMQVLTSSGTGDVRGGGKIPDWDKTKKVYNQIKKVLGRPAKRDDDIAALIGKEAFQAIQTSIMADANNANKYIAAAKLGPEFMNLYETVNTMHMQCKFFHFAFDFLLGMKK